MPTLTIHDKPTNTFQSVYSPIKVMAQLDSTDRETYPSVVAIVTPYDSFNEVFDYTKQVRIRVPAQPIPPTNIDQTSWTATSNLFYSVDLSSVCKDFVSIDLRPCTQETRGFAERDMTQSQISFHTFQVISVTMRAEVVNSAGVLAEDSSIDDSIQFIAFNGTLSNEEMEPSYIDGNVDTGANNMVLGQNFFRRFLHRADHTNEEIGRIKYLTTKSTKHREIGEDEVEYISFLTQRFDNTDNGTTDDIYGQISFFDLNGNQIKDKNGERLRLTISKTALGDGTYTSTVSLLNKGSGSDLDAGIVQVGVGTRNIAESNIRWSGGTSGVHSIRDFSGISRYEFETREELNNTKIGEKVVFHINHEKNNIGRTRLHWQNRLGGIDSYTFYDTAIRSLSTSSQSFEQTIHPEFGDKTRSSTSNSVLRATSLVQGTGGIEKASRHSISKSKVKAYKEGQLISRPIHSDYEMEMFNDIMSSPRVWIEGGWRKKEVYRDEFNYTTGGTGFTNKYATIGSAEVSFDNNTADNPMALTAKYIQIGNGSGNDELVFYSKQIFPYDHQKLYEFEIRVKQNGGTGKLYFGFLGFAEDGTTKISTLGADQTGNAHYVAVNDETPPDDEYKTYRGYVQGLTSDSTIAGNSSDDPNQPAYAFDGVKFFAPYVIANYNNMSGRTKIDYIKVTECESDIINNQSWLSTLNKNYYIPIVVKDGSITSFDSNNLSKITINYMHSKEQKTIR